jgi:hypothetical protein
MPYLDIRTSKQQDLDSEDKCKIISYNVSINAFNFLAAEESCLGLLPKSVVADI